MVYKSLDVESYFVIILKYVTFLLAGYVVNNDLNIKIIIAKALINIISHNARF